MMHPGMASGERTMQRRVTWAKLGFPTPSWHRSVPRDLSERARGRLGVQVCCCSSLPTAPTLLGLLACLGLCGETGGPASILPDLCLDVVRVPVEAHVGHVVIPAPVEFLDLVRGHSRDCLVVEDNPLAVVLLDPRNVVAALRCAALVCDDGEELVASREVVPRCDGLRELDRRKVGASVSGGGCAAIHIHCRCSSGLTLGGGGAPSFRNCLLLELAPVRVDSLGEVWVEEVPQVEHVWEGHFLEHLAALLRVSPPGEAHELDWQVGREASDARRLLVPSLSAECMGVLVDHLLQ
mmetsp:Transcript_2785/g.8003  ORF Transcript_2785/g.8003 Transcript_2785/m.8003 type:complete len:295 (-) Transcript_2785:899-1783(-)